MRAATWKTTASIPADTAMAVLIQPLVAARASGGGLSETAEGQMLLSATWGLGSAIAQGEVVPDRIVLSRQGFLRNDRAPAARITARPASTAPAPCRRRCRRRSVREPCLDAGAGGRRSGACCARPKTCSGMPVEIEWALDEHGFKLLQARPLHVEPAHVPDEIWLQHPGLNGHPGRHRLGLRPRRAWSTANASSRASRPATSW